MKDLQVFFTALNSFFDHIYVITLERAKERQQHIQQELQGLNYQFFFGKDKHYYSVEELKASNIYNEALAKQHHRYGKPMQAGQICCAWSHAEVYKDMVKKGYRNALIMEDDVVIDKESAQIFSVITKELPADWEFLYLGFDEREKAPAGAFFKKLFYHVLRLFKIIRFSHKTISHLYPRKFSAHLYKAGYHDCIHAYGITQSAAQSLAKLQQPVSFVADNLTAHAITNQLIKGYIVLPKIIYQQNHLNTLQTSYVNP